LTASTDPLSLPLMELGDDPFELIERAQYELDHGLMASRLVRPSGGVTTLQKRLQNARAALELATANWKRSGPTSRAKANVQRRRFLKLGPALAGTALLPPGLCDALERLQATPESTRVDADLVDALRTLVAGYADAYHGMDLAALAPVVADLVDRIAVHLSDPLALGQRGALSRIAAEGAALAGWLGFTMDQPGAARAYLSFARDAARDADDPLLHAVVLGSVSFLHSAPAHGHRAASPVALRLLAQTDALLPTHAPALIRSWAAARLAEEHAAAGNADTSARFMDRAEALLPEAPSTERTGLLFYDVGGFFLGWGQPRIDGYRGLVESLNGQPERAARTLTAALAATPNDRDRVVVRADLARAYIQLGEPEHASAVALEAVDGAEAMGFDLGLDRLRGVAAELAPWNRLPGARQLVERLRA
jgi:tetratricopeptide (TPR) repeat protein